MSGVAMNRETGEIVVLSQEGQWEPARRARNPQSGKELFFDGREWRDVPAIPERPTSPARAVGLGVRDVAEGMLGLPNMLLGAPQALRNAVLAAAGMPTEPTYADRTARAMDATGLPSPETRTERSVSAVNRSVAGSMPLFGVGAALQGARQGAGMAPAAANMLVGNLPSQIAGAAGAGYAGQEVAEAGYGPVAQLAAGVAGGAGGAGAMQALQTGGRSVAAIAQPFSEQGRRQIAADVLLRSSADPEGLPARIAQGMDDPGRRLPGSAVSTAQASRDPGLMLLESGMRSQAAPTTPTSLSPAIAIREVEAQRNQSRLAALAGLQDGATPEARGAAVRTALRGSEDAMGARVDMAFNVARDRNVNRYSVEPVLETATRATRMFDPRQGGGGVPSELQGVIDDIARMERVTLSQAQNIRSRLGEIAGKAGVAGDNRLASAATAISQSLESTIDDPRWMQAVALRREQGQALGRDQTGAAVTGQILREDRFGAPTMPDATVASRATASPQSARQTLEAMYKALDDARRARLPAEEIAALRQQMVEARGAMRGQFVDDLMRAASTTGDIADAAGNVSRALSPAQFRRFWEQNEGVAREIFEPGQLAQFRRIAADFAESSMLTRTVSAAGSPTAQNLSVGNLIARSSNGLIDPGMPLAQTMGSLGGVMRLVYAAPEAATREILTQAVTDPRFAQMLLRRASPASVTQAARYIEANMMDRLAQAAGDAGGRVAIRAATAEATQPQQ